MAVALQVESILIKIVVILLSWLVVGFGQPAWSTFCSSLAAVVGYALFWVGIADLSPKRRVLASGAWFTCVQLVQLSWMTSIEYQGIYILFVYGILCVLWGAQFALLTGFLRDLRRLSLLTLLGGAALWTIMEWLRLGVLCGFTWNPSGLSLAAHSLTAQGAALVGVYGLSFWVIFVNLLALRAYFSLPIKKRCFHWMVGALVPLLFGWMHLHLPSDTQGKSLSVALVQTGLLPSQKVPLPGKKEAFISPVDQWKQVIALLEAKGKDRWDLIVCPEAVVPFSANESIYLYAPIKDWIEKELGASWAQEQPPLVLPYAQHKEWGGQKVWCVSNAFWVQLISNYFRAEVVAGLDHQDWKEGKNYNSAFHFYPHQRFQHRYDKQVLLPLAEYLPFSSLRKWTERYGISAFFTPGQTAFVTGMRVPLSISICYEETFGDLMRAGRQKGAQLFVNVTNDNYYPHSRLPEQHFSLARLRAIENGIPLIRACNTGVTAVIDRFGNIAARLGHPGKDSEWIQDVLDYSLEIKGHSTLYSYWGDLGILSLCVLFLSYEIKKNWSFVKIFLARKVKIRLKKKRVVR